MKFIKEYTRDLLCSEIVWGMKFTAVNKTDKNSQSQKTGNICQGKNVFPLLVSSCSQKKARDTNLLQSSYKLVTKGNWLQTCYKVICYCKQS